MSRRLEDAIQTTIITYLRFALPKAIIFSIPNEGKRSPRLAAAMKRRGMLPGVPDICIIGRNSKAYFIEVKSKKGTLTDNQKAVAEMMVNRSVPHIVARSIDDVEDALRKWELI